MDLSSVSVDEYIVLQATLASIDNKEYECKSCLTKFRGRQDEKVMLEKSRVLKGCFQTSKVVFPIGNLEFRRCPGNYTAPVVFNFYELFEKYKSGTMPFSGGMAEQPNKIIEVFRIIGSYEYEKQKREIARQNGRRSQSQNRR